jgi:hypothetical protein
MQSARCQSKGNEREKNAFEEAHHRSRIGVQRRKGLPAASLNIDSVDEAPTSDRRVIQADLPVFSVTSRRSTLPPQ